MVWGRGARKEITIVVFVVAILELASAADDQTLSDELFILFLQHGEFEARCSQTVFVPNGLVNARWFQIIILTVILAVFLHSYISRFN